MRDSQWFGPQMLPTDPRNAHHQALQMNVAERQESRVAAEVFHGVSKILEALGPFPVMMLSAKAQRNDQ